MDNRSWILGILGFALVFGYYGWAWNAVGRDPKGGTIIPLFHPPQGVSPALANYIRNWGLSDRWRAFTAAALSLAVRGLIVFDQGADTLTLKTRGKAPDGASGTLPPGERSIFDWVEGRGGTAVISRDNGAAVAALATKFQNDIEGENKTRFFRRNLGYFIAGLALTVLVFVAVLVFGGLRETDLGLLIALLFGGVFLGVFAIPVLMAVAGSVRFGSVVRKLIVAFVIAFFLIQGGAVLLAVASEQEIDWDAIRSFVAGHSFPFALVLGFGALNGVFLYLLRAPTDIGRKVTDQLAGLQLYLETAEADRLNLQAPEITTERFEALLPYAVALGVEKPWSDAFTAALARAHPGDAEPMSHYQPGWVSGGAWSSRSFGSAIASTVTGVGTAFASAMPVSSSSSSGFSSSGGGGSGGGGGGGGGGGW